MHSSNLQEELSNLPTQYLGVDYGDFPKVLYDIYREDHIKHYFSTRKVDRYTRMAEKIETAFNKGNYLFHCDMHGDPVYHEVMQINGWKKHLKNLAEQYVNRKIQVREYKLQKQLKIRLYVKEIVVVSGKKSQKTV